jgi:type VI protein secretion system component VasK
MTVEERGGPEHDTHADLHRGVRIADEMHRATIALLQERLAAAGARVAELEAALAEAEKERESQRSDAVKFYGMLVTAESRLDEAVGVLRALVDESDPAILTTMATLLRATGNTPQADVCTFLARLDGEVKP